MSLSATQQCSTVTQDDRLLFFVNTTIRKPGGFSIVFFAFTNENDLSNATAFFLFHKGWCIPYVEEMASQLLAADVGVVFRMRVNVTL